MPGKLGDFLRYSLTRKKIIKNALMTLIFMSTPFSRKCVLGHRSYEEWRARHGQIPESWARNQEGKEKKHPSQWQIWQSWGLILDRFVNPGARKLIPEIFTLRNLAKELAATKKIPSLETPDMVFSSLPLVS